jgi:hypothetical protein
LVIFLLLESCGKGVLPTGLEGTMGLTGAKLWVRGAVKKNEKFLNKMLAKVARRVIMDNVIYRSFLLNVLVL